VRWLVLLQVSMLSLVVRCGRHRETPVGDTCTLIGAWASKYSTVSSIENFTSNLAELHDQIRPVATSTNRKSGLRWNMKKPRHATAPRAVVKGQAAPGGGPMGSTRRGVGVGRRGQAAWMFGLSTRREPVMSLERQRSEGPNRSWGALDGEGGVIVPPMPWAGLEAIRSVGPAASASVAASPNPSLMDGKAKAPYPLVLQG
jgi:hypothetical protein